MRPNFILFCLLLFVLFAACFFVSCSTRTLESIEGRIMFQVWEDYTQYDCNCEPSLVLSMETEKIYPCCNYTIKSEIKRSGSTITVKFLGIHMPEVCLTALGPAASKHFLDLREGIYSLIFVNGFAVNTYLLNVKPDVIEVGSMMPISHFTEPKIRIYWRYPRNSFVYLCGTMTETAWICSDFLSLLLKEIDLEEFQFPDYGEICYPRSSEGHYNDMPAKYFIYKSEADFDKAGEILKSYAKSVLSHYSGVGLSLTNWKNKFYYSWLFTSP